MTTPPPPPPPTKTTTTTTDESTTTNDNNTDEITKPIQTNDNSNKTNPPEITSSSLSEKQTIHATALPNLPSFSSSSSSYPSSSFTEKEEIKTATTITNKILASNNSRKRNQTEEKNNNTETTKHQNLNASMDPNPNITASTSLSSCTSFTPTTKPSSSSSSSSPKQTAKRHRPHHHHHHHRHPQKQPLHVEAILHPACPIPLSTIRNVLYKYIESIGRVSLLYKAGSIDFKKKREGGLDVPNVIRESCLDVSIVGLDEEEEDDENEDDDDEEDEDDCGKEDNTNQKGESNTIAYWQVSSIQIHTYTLSTEEAELEELDADDPDNDEELIACETLPLPHTSLHTTWQNLILPPKTKRNLLHYASTALLFTHHHVSPHLISWNRLVLLHGPPGTGKTSLCRALAQQLVIRLNHRKFTSGGYLLEIHSHSLFSKWFSESGKLVSKLFGRIKEMVEDDENALICVLVDEVESLAAMRGGGGGGGEPSDAIRAVNSLLTSIDKLKRYPNVIVMTTTNITGSVDSAFVDRADIKQYIGLPSLHARYEILRSCVEELVRVGIVVVVDDEDLKERDGSKVGGKESECNTKHDASKTRGDLISQTTSLVSNQQKNALPSYREVRSHKTTASCTSSFSSSSYIKEGKILLQCAKNAKNMSGRTLRRLPFQSHALFIRSDEPVSLGEFLDALMDGIDHELESRRKLDE